MDIFGFSLTEILMLVVFISTCLMLLLLVLMLISTSLRNLLITTLLYSMNIFFLARENGIKEINDSVFFVFAVYALLIYGCIYRFREKRNFSNDQKSADIVKEDNEWLSSRLEKK